MAEHAHSSAPEVPAELVARHQAGWKAFTQGLAINCVFVAAVLVFLLVVFKIL